MTSLDQQRRGTLSIIRDRNIIKYQINDYSNYAKHIIYLEGLQILISGETSYHDRIECHNEMCGCRTNPFVWQSDKHRLVYYEVPKAASTSIRSMLQLNYSIENRLSLLVYKCIKKNELTINVFWNSSWEFRYFRILLDRAIKKVFYLEKKPFFNLRPNKLSNLFKPQAWVAVMDERGIDPDFQSFAIVRSPFDRVVSNWLMFTKSKERGKWFSTSFAKPADQVSLDEFVSRLEEIKNHHWQPQVNFLPIVEDRIDVTAIIKMENINESWYNLSTQYNLPPNLPRINSSNKIDLSTNLFNKTVRKKINKVYQRDFELLYPELI